MRTRRLIGLVALAVSLTLTAACTDTGPGPGAPSSSPTATDGPVALTIAVYGAVPEVAAYQRITDAWNREHPLQQLTLVSLGDRDEQRAALTSGRPLPDLFLTSRRELGWLVGHEAIQPVGELLDERGVDFGDDFQRDAITAFSAHDDLQCMPWGVSPMVIYYNTDLIDFDVMALEGLDAPIDHTAWTFEQFEAAARAAVQEQPGARGLQIDRTLRGLAPFIYSAGGQVFDNDVTPTAMAFSSDGTRSALEKTLPVLRDPLLTLTDQQLAEATPLEWFERGQLGMIEGFRSLTPELRDVLGLSFDVMPIPAVNDSRTLGDITGLCLSKTAASAGVGADVLHFFGTPDNVAQVARAGYLVPANVQVAESGAFLQPNRDPAHASVFNDTVRNIVNPPLLDDYEALEAAIAPDFAMLFATGVLDLKSVTEAIDADAQPVLDSLQPTPSP